MSYDELELDRIGDRKTAVFFIISDTTQTYNFLAVSYTHLTAIIGLESGSTILRKKPISLQPSKEAASNSSSGMVLCR